MPPANTTTSTITAAAQVSTTVPDIEECYGSVVVTDKCTGCITCRVLAPDIFHEARPSSTNPKIFTEVSPQTGHLLQSLDQALAVRDAILQCPVGAIKWTKRPKILSSSTKKNHTHTPTPLPKLTDGYPKLLEDNVYLAGPPSRALFGGASYFIKGGGQNGKENILIDTPDASPEIVERIKKMGGVSYIVFTHVDHVGLHEEWKKAFPGVERVMHADDFNEGTKGFEIMLQGSNSGSSDGSGGTKEIQTDTHTHSSSDDNEKGKKKLVGTVTAAVAALFSSSSPSRSPSSPSPSTTTISSPPPLTCTLPGWEKDLKLIHAPGHTPGCIFILYKDKFLFTGDSLQYSRVTGGGHLVGYRLHCWQSWSLQQHSWQQLHTHFSFLYVLPGHGEPHRFKTHTHAHQSLGAALQWARQFPDGHTPMKRFRMWVALRVGMAASSTNTKASFLRWVADNLVLPSGSKLAIPYYAPTHAHTHTHTHKLSFWKVSSFLSSSPVAVSLVVGTVVLAAVVGGQRRKG